MLAVTLECGACLTSGFALGLFSAFVIKKRKIVPLFLKYFTQSMQKKGGVKLVLVTRSDLGMGKGKLASQCSHAAVCCYKEAITVCPEVLAVWEMLGQPKIVCKSDSAGDKGMLSMAQQAKDMGLVSSVIRDAGRTQVDSGSVTVVGIGPGDAEQINRLTTHLKLL